MLIGLNRQPKEGEIIEVKLNFMHAGSVTIKAPVKKGGMMKKMMMHNMQ
jgi:copper(I)-binding protein